MDTKVTCVITRLEYVLIRERERESKLGGLVQFCHVSGDLSYNTGKSKIYCNVRYAFIYIFSIDARELPATHIMVVMSLVKDKENLRFQL